MTKNEYLKNLAGSLNGHMTREEISDILRDYREFFDDGALQNEEEWQTAERLGDPKEVAAQIVAESYIGQAQEKPTIKNLFKAQSAVKVYSTAAFILSIPLMAVVAGLALILLLMFLALAVSSVGIFTGILMMMGALPSTAIWLACVAAVGTLFASITMLLVAIILVRAFIRWLSGLFVKAIVKPQNIPSEQPQDFDNISGEGTNHD